MALVLTKKLTLLKSNNERNVAFEKSSLGMALPNQALLSQIGMVELLSRNLKNDECGLTVKDV